MNIKLLTAGALCAAISFGSAAPAFADGAAATRNTLIGVAAAVIGLSNWNNKRHIKQQEHQEQGRRQQAYREWYYKKYGRYPTENEFRQWYVKTYGVEPS